MHRVTNGQQATCPAAVKGVGCGGLSMLTSCLAPSSYRSASILFSSCQNSRLRIDWSLLHLIFTRSNNKARAKRSCWQGESARMPLKQAFSLKVRQRSPGNADEPSSRAAVSSQAGNRTQVHSAGRTQNQLF